MRAQKTHDFPSSQVVCFLRPVNSYLRRAFWGLGLMVLSMLAFSPREAQARDIKIVAFGDSLTAGYGLKPDEAFPAQLERALKAKGYQVSVANAGVSGDTTAGGLERFDWSIPDGTDAVILELGANDALRGINPALSRKALAEILSRLKARKIDVLVTGMQAPTNWGAAFKSEFDGMFKQLADEYGALLYPFYLEGVAMDASLNLPDGLHPTGKGIGVIVERIMPKVEELIGRVKARS